MVAASTGNVDFTAKSFRLGRLVVVGASYFRADHTALVAHTEGFTRIGALMFAVYITACKKTKKLYFS